MSELRLPYLIGTVAECDPQTVTVKDIETGEVKLLRLEGMPQEAVSLLPELRESGEVFYFAYLPDDMKLFALASLDEGLPVN